MCSWGLGLVVGMVWVGILVRACGFSIRAGDTEGTNIGAEIITNTFFFFWGGGFLLIIMVEWAPKTLSPIVNPKHGLGFRV